MEVKVGIYTVECDCREMVPLSQDPDNPYRFSFVCDKCGLQDTITIQQDDKQKFAEVLKEVDH